MTGTRVKNILLVALVAVMINLPLLHSAWQDHRIAQDGVDVTARVTDHRESKGEYFVTFTVDGKDDKPEIEGLSRVDRETYDTAVRTQQVEVRVLPGEKGAWTVEGAVTSRVGLVVTLVADLFLLLMVLLLVRFGSRLKSELVLRATEDLERCPPGSVLDRLDGLRYVVCGEIDTIGDDEVVLDLGDRRVRVLLDGHHNPAGYQQPVRVTGTMLA